jgi:hypothetical protein
MDFDKGNNRVLVIAMGNLGFVPFTTGGGSSEVSTNATREPINVFA